MFTILEQRYDPSNRIDPVFQYMHSTIFETRGQARDRIDWELDRERHDDSPLNAGEIVRFSVCDITLSYTLKATTGELA